MKTLVFNLVLVLGIMSTGSLLAHDHDLKGKHTKEKTIKKEFKVSASGLLKVDNSFGNLVLTSWNEDRIAIEVHIKTNGDNEEKVQEKLDEISVEFEQSGETVSAKTKFNKGKTGWNWNWGGNKNVSMQVNYTIKLPVKHNVNLSNDYGAIILDRIDGHAKISCDYGRLDIGELRGRSNQLSFDYTSKSTIGYINSGSISADYSGFTIEKAGDLQLNADYTNASVGSMENLEYRCDYGHLEVKEMNNVKGSGDYIDIALGTVHGNVDINADYGGISIDRMAADAGNLTIDSDYTGVKVGYAPQYNFSFEISAQYADVKGLDEMETDIRKIESVSKYYKGRYGSNADGKKVYINSSYGGIRLYKI